MATAGLSLLPGCRSHTPLQGVHIGVIDLNTDIGGLGKTAQVEAVSKASEIGFEGLEVTFGGPDDDGMLLLAYEDRQQQYLEAFQEYGIRAAGTHMWVLHTNVLKDPNDPLGRHWVEMAIPVTRNLNTEVILLPFFWDGELKTRDEMNYVGDLLSELGTEAENHGVILGIENTLSAEDNMRILERADSPAVQVYYDVGNSFNYGYDIYNEIRWLGSEHICQFHLKDNPHYLGEGEIDIREVLKAIDEIGFSGWVNLETVAPSGDIRSDMKRNLEYTQNVIDTL